MTDRFTSLFVHETRLHNLGKHCIAGIDEAGRGPLAGPVFAAACILLPGAIFPSINDSKQLSEKQREILFQEITEHPQVRYGVGRASVAEIERINILRATFLAMRRAVMNLPIKPDYLLIDGNQSPQWKIPFETIVDGDALSASIAAASIIAKVLRDREMKKHSKKWPLYKFETNKGYGTEKHLEALAMWGPCPLHRKTFGPVRERLMKDDFPLLHHP